MGVVDAAGNGHIVGGASENVGPAKVFEGKLGCAFNRAVTNVPDTPPERAREFAATPLAGSPGCTALLPTSFASAWLVRGRGPQTRLAFR